MWRIAMSDEKKSEKIQFSTYPNQFQRNQFEAFSFETFDDFADESTLNTVWFDHDECTFLVSSHFFCDYWE